jgi:hypothetical protein
MMMYPLLAAREAPSISRVYVSTDSPLIREIAKKQGAEVIDRPPELATAKALGEDVFVHGYHWIRSREKDPIEAMVLMFCNAPTILAATLEEGINLLRFNSQLDSVVTVSRYNMWSPLRARRLTAAGTLEPFVPLETFGDPKTMNCDRDSQGDVYFADMSASIVRPRCLEQIQEGLLPQRWMGRRIGALPQWGGCDVDYSWQIPGVEYWLKINGFSDSKTPYSGEMTSAKTI